MRALATVVLAACTAGGTAAPGGADTDAPLVLGPADAGSTTTVALATSQGAFVQIFPIAVSCEERSLDATYKRAGVVLELRFASWPPPRGDVVYGGDDRAVFVAADLSRTRADGDVQVDSSSADAAELRVRLDAAGWQARGRLTATPCP